MGPEKTRLVVCGLEIRSQQCRRKQPTFLVRVAAIIRYHQTAADDHRGQSVVAVSSVETDREQDEDFKQLILPLIGHSDVMERESSSSAQ